MIPLAARGYQGPARRRSQGRNKPIRRIVLHSTVSPCMPGQARKTAAYFRGSSARGSAHYAVDPVEAVQCDWDDVILWHAPPNKGSLGVEMCEYPSQDIKRWDERNHRLMFEEATQLVAELCVLHNVPPWYIGATQLRLGRRGVTTHAQVSAAFKQSTHWDPGAWPRARFMRAVRTKRRAILAAQKRKR